jgi:hypothetical protein
LCSKVSGYLRRWKEEKLLSNCSHKDNAKLVTRTSENIPIDSSQNIPIDLLVQYGSGGGSNCIRRRYTRVQEIEGLAASKYKENGKGITFNDLLSNEFALHKKQAQITLKHCLEKQVLFTISNHKPQRYYPTSLRAEILKNKLSKNLPIGVTEVVFSDPPHFSINTNSDKATSNRRNKSIVAIQSLEGYVMPLLPSAPLFIHKIQLKLRIDPECYDELDLSIGKGNNGKEHVEVIGNVRVSYRFYANGTVMVFTESSNNPFKLEDQTDLSRLIAFFGQVRDRLVISLADTHERIIPGILEWELTQCDINKDIKVGEGLQYTGLKVQVKHFDRLFRVYIKSIGKDTVCRVEESLNSKKSAIDTLNNIFNPIEKTEEKKIEEVNKKLDLVLSIIGNDKYNYNDNADNFNTDHKKGGATI